MCDLTSLDVREEWNICGLIMGSMIRKKVMRILCGWPKLHVQNDIWPRFWKKQRWPWAWAWGREEGNALACESTLLYYWISWTQARASAREEGIARAQGSDTNERLYIFLFKIWIKMLFPWNLGHPYKNLVNHLDQTF